VLSRRADPIVAGFTLVIAFVLLYVHVWQHHHAATILAGLAMLIALVLAELAKRSVTGVAVASLVLLALPTPFAFLDPHRDLAVCDRSPRWGVLAILPPLCEAAPAAALLAVGVRGLLRLPAAGWLAYATNGR
jgi:hypothetical protein